MQQIAGRFHAGVAWPIFTWWTLVAAAGILLGRVLLRWDPVRRVGTCAIGLAWGQLLWCTQPFWHRTFTGLENLPSGPCVLVANHESSIDILALFGLPVPLKMVAKPANFSHPVMGRFLTLSGQVSTGDFLAEATAALDAGISVLVFAEGSRMPGVALRRFKNGAFVLAARTGYPVVPIAVVGCTRIAPKDRWVPTRLVVPVWIAVGPAIHGDDPAVLKTAAHAAVSKLRTQMGALG